MRRVIARSFLPVAAFARFHGTKQFTDSHEWVAINNGVATIGITNHAQEALGKIVFLGTGNVGDSFKAGEDIGDLESVKATAKIYAPVSGTIVEVNEKLASTPGLVNTAPETDGWIVKLKDVQTPKKLLSEAEYNKFLESEQH